MKVLKRIKDGAMFPLPSHWEEHGGNNREDVIVVDLEEKENLGLSQQQEQPKEGWAGGTVLVGPNSTHAIQKPHDECTDKRLWFAYAEEFLGYKPHPNIRLDTLIERINEKEKAMQNGD